MFVVTDADLADLVVIRRAFMQGGRQGAIAELQCRWLGVSDRAAPEVLDRVLAMPIDLPPHAGRQEPRRDGPASPRRRSSN